MKAKASEYPKGWKEFATLVKEDAGWKCERCGHPNDLKTGHVLTVHHLTNDKQQPFSDRWAFAALCQRCHLKVQGRVRMEQTFMAEILDVSEWFKPHLAGFLASKLPETTAGYGGAEPPSLPADTLAGVADDRERGGRENFNTKGK